MQPLVNINQVKCWYLCFNEDKKRGEMWLGHTPGTQSRKGALELGIIDIYGCRSCWAA